MVMSSQARARTVASVGVHGYNGCDSLVGECWDIGGNLGWKKSRPSLVWVRFARVGSIVLAIHDASDVFMEIGKMSKYTGCEWLASISFILFVASWVALRLIYFPFWVIWSTSYEVVLTLDKEKHKVDGPIYYYVFNSLLISLLVLHIYWWVLIFRMIIKQIQAKGQISDDVRSDSEGEDEHED